MTISYSFGIIDFLHFGHIRLFEQTQKTSNKHIFGLIADDAIIAWHGTLVSTFEERYSVLSGVKYIDEIWEQESFDPLLNLKRIHAENPDAKIVLYIGNDRKFVPCETYIKEIGGEIQTVDYYEKLSPQNILDSLIVKTKRTKHYASNLISTKANTLLALKPAITKSRIEDIYILTVQEFHSELNKVLREIKITFGGDLIVVRSSSVAEDSFKKSNAGHYDSVLHVDSANEDSVQKAISKVVASYDRTSDTFFDEQILIQRQTRNVVCSGVLFTRDLDSNLPYYLINYDDNSRLTDSVTSGNGGNTVWILRKVGKYNPPAKWKKLLEAIIELESLLNRMVLDIEFAITSENEIIIFQVRPLAANYKFQVMKNDEKFYGIHEKEVLNYTTIRNYQTMKPMIFSDMAFWNPAEIIGVSPHNLDYSLYREIITKSVWNEGLIPLGYKKVSDELMFKVANKPYISVDYSFLSLIPADVGEDIAKKLYVFYMDKLLKDRTAHDKIEFEIVLSCFDFSTESRLNDLISSGFTNDECLSIKDSLFKLTNNIISNYDSILLSDKRDIEELENVRLKIERDNELKDCNIYVLLQAVYRLLSSIKKYGTPQFSRQARCAFISRSLCKTMVAKGWVSEEVMDVFMSSIHTVASDFDRDFKNMLLKKISKRTFDERYGHLRCGTYNIQSLRYDKIDFCLTESMGNKTSPRINEQQHEQQQLALEKMKKSFEQLRFSAPLEKILYFVSTSLEQREYFKFEFTKSLSLLLEIIEKIGARMDKSTYDLSFLEVSDIYAAEYYSSVSDIKGFWSTLISRRKELFADRSMMILPELIVTLEDMEVIELSESRPNFVTASKIEADVICLDDIESHTIENKIVVISKADPGYDWIFAKGIAGLVTKYGGAASHMAIRCAEFSLPAAIGCGEKIYDYVVKSNRIEIDCSNNRITRMF